MNGTLGRNANEGARPNRGTERTTPDLSENDFRKVCESLAAGVFLLQDNCVRYANLAGCEIFAREPSELIGKPLSELIHPEDRAEVEAYVTARRQIDADHGAVRFRVVPSDQRPVVAELRSSELDWRGSPAILGIVLDVTSAVLADSARQDHLRFERMLANLSASFINLACDQIGEQIDTSLQSLVDTLGNDRSTLVEFGDDEASVLVSHSFAAAGCSPFPVGPLEAARFPWFINQFRSGKLVYLRDVENELPAEAIAEREYCRTHGLQSHITLPLRAGGVALGGLTFAFIRSRCEWPREVVSRLQLFGEVIAGALLRSRTEQALRAALEENEALRRRLTQENLYLREQAVLRPQYGRIIGTSEAMTHVLIDAECVAPTDAPVLLTGETGTGKELLAQTIHELSRRKDRPMVVVNCASLPATLVESELFGRAAGAYTGAASAQIGRFELADRSTLFLDEIGEFPLELQAKLLRVLQDGRFERLGSSKTVSVDVRIIAATNRDLQASVQAGKFRADLFHRLDVFPIHVPPLRERREDIPPLVWSFVELLGRRMGKVITTISRKTMQQLQQYDWPGNVRELSNVIERAMILTKDDVLHAVLPIKVGAEAGSGATLKETECDQILRVLRQTGWRIRGSGGAAERLDVKPTTLEARMGKLGIRRPSKGATAAKAPRHPFDTEGPS